MEHILLVEDDVTYSRIIQSFLEKNNFKVTSCTKLSDIDYTLKNHQIKLVVTDFRLPDGTGLQVLKKVKDNYPDVEVILITNYSDIRIAVKAMKMGAFEYITKPINPDELLLTVKEAIKIDQKSQKNPKIAPQKNEDYIIGESSDAKKLEEHIDLVAPTELSIIVLGETGTGKEYISKRIHKKSARREAPFIAVDCGALSKELAGSELFGHVKGAFTGALENKIGHFEAASGGTIFLDEIGNLDYEIQIKLLRAIEERKIRKIGGSKEINIDVRIIAATNENLIGQSQEGAFREDLYHRLNEFSLTAMPLRDRKEDLESFCNQFLIESNQKLNKSIKGFSPTVIALFKEYHWPGNLRELKNIVRRAVLLSKSDTIEIEMIPDQLKNFLLKNELVQDADITTNNLASQEKELIEKTLKEVKYNKTKAAKQLGIDRKTLYNKMNRFGIE
ncbi:sigma-54-dependent transcriptional regulator [Belliella aquatica]|uniref:Sigma-54-dependent Fis family transcriptional regulator n=1 Tax=Belliella aquatica TaxID=1323734 RepID=A0ABQ1MNP8_9BACT|nr:sigma-54 dependent transcriptional regulator [Belliella aquatica]MCH7405041.1 sigma-54 dependent transcriptional regulator [Belliella aquatica]GGC40343.1 sigma-54-dependent Fis family transcriptional regulator [Belliella aquatica]